MLTERAGIPTVILECIDAVRDAYQKTAVDIPTLESTLEILTSVTQFATIMLVADPQAGMEYSTHSAQKIDEGD
jgi:hypothetical protein